MALVSLQRFVAQQLRMLRITIAVLMEEAMMMRIVYVLVLKPLFVWRTMTPSLMFVVRMSKRKIPIVLLELEAQPMLLLARIATLEM